MLSEQIKKLTYKQVKYIFISVGTNDLDLKDHKQVFGELLILIDDIRARFPGIKIIINELLPRKDARNNEVGKFNAVLSTFTNSQEDITVALQRITDMSMFYDNKHLYPIKVGVYAKNIINALLKAYGIQDKSELFSSPRIRDIHSENMNFQNRNMDRNEYGERHEYDQQRVRSTTNAGHDEYGQQARNVRVDSEHIQNRMFRIADYTDSEHSVSRPQGNKTSVVNGNDNQTNNNEIIRDALVQFSNVIMKCIQR